MAKIGYLFRNRLTGKYCFDNSHVMGEKNRNEYDNLASALGAAKREFDGRQAILGLEALSEEEEKAIVGRLGSSRVAVIAADELMKRMKDGSF